MTLNHDNGDPREWAALYASGALDPAQVGAFEAHLRAGCPECLAGLSELRPVVEALAEVEVEPVQPRPEVKASLLARIDADLRERGAAAGGRPAAGDASRDPNPQVWRDWTADAIDQDVVLRDALHSGWEETGITGIRVRRLCVDPTRNQMTALVRMAPGTAYPAHKHNGPEECLVLEGDLRAGDDHFHAGDYQRMGVGSRHVVQSTESGCLLLIISSLSDDMD